MIKIRPLNSLKTAFRFTPLESPAPLAGDKYNPQSLFLERVRFKASAFLTGFTLIELFLYVCLFILVLGTILSFVFWTIQINAKSKAKRETIESARQSADIIIQEIKRANEIYLPTSQFETSPGQLSLETTKNLPFGETLTYVDIYLDNGKIYLKREGALTVPITPESVKVNTLVFMRIKSLLNPDAPASIRMGLEVEYNTSSTKAQWQSKTAFISAAGTLRIQ